jgi:hypothetical protein
MSNPGFAGTVAAVVSANTIPMHEPAPISAARVDTPTTSFGRMRMFPSSELFPIDACKCGKKNAAKDNTGLRGPSPQIFKPGLIAANSIQEQKRPITDAK